MLLNSKQRTADDSFSSKIANSFENRRRNSNRTAGRTLRVKKTTETTGDERLVRIDANETTRHFSLSAVILRSDAARRGAAPTTVTSFMERAPNSLVPVPQRGRDPKATVTGS